MKKELRICPGIAVSLLLVQITQQAICQDFKESSKLFPQNARLILRVDLAKVLQTQVYKDFKAGYSKEHSTLLRSMYLPSDPNAFTVLSADLAWSFGASPSRSTVVRCNADTLADKVIKEWFREELAFGKALSGSNELFTSRFGRVSFSLPDKRTLLAAPTELEEAMILKRDSPAIEHSSLKQADDLADSPVKLIGARVLEDPDSSGQGSALLDAARRASYFNLNMSLSDPVEIKGVFVFELSATASDVEQKLKQELASIEIPDSNPNHYLSTVKSTQIVRADRKIELKLNPTVKQLVEFSRDITQTIP